MMNVSTIQFGDEGQVATRELVRRFAPVVPEALATCLRTFESIDRHHGGSGPLPLEDAGDLADAALADAASLGHDDLTLGSREAPHRRIDRGRETFTEDGLGRLGHVG